MNDLNGAAEKNSAAILRKLAASSRTPAELGALLAAMPFSEIQQLLNDLADALDALARLPPAHAGADAELSGEKTSAAPSPTNENAPEAKPGARGQTCFSFGSQPPKESDAPETPEKLSAASEKAASEKSSTAPRRLLLYSDGAARGNPGPSGAGAVLMMPDGKIVARLGKYLGIQTNNHAEYTAAILGLEAALKLGATEVEMIADSELLVKQVSGVYKVKNEHLKELCARVRELMHRFDKATIRHVLRAYNKEADEMSNRAIDERM